MFWVQLCIYMIIIVKYIIFKQMFILFGLFCPDVCAPIKRWRVGGLKASKQRSCWNDIRRALNEDSATNVTLNDVDVISLAQHGFVIYIINEQFVNRTTVNNDFRFLVHNCFWDVREAIIYHERNLGVI